MWDFSCFFSICLWADNVLYNVATSTVWSTNIKNYRQKRLVVRWKKKLSLKLFLAYAVAIITVENSFTINQKKKDTFWTHKYHKFWTHKFDENIFPAPFVLKRQIPISWVSHGGRVLLFGKKLGRNEVPGACVDKLHLCCALHMLLLIIL